MKASTKSGLALIVEDETLVRLMAIDMLEEFGFEAVEAASASEAMEAFSARPGEFALVMIDIGLPDKRGDQLALALRAQRSSLPVLIASGAEMNAIKSGGDPLMAVLAKPYTAEMLGNALKSLGIDVQFQS